MEDLIPSAYGYQPQGFPPTGPAPAAGAVPALRNIRAAIDGPSITFDPGADNPVTRPTADMIEQVLRAYATQLGITGVNISSTTNHGRGTRHAPGRAVDINRINDVHVGDPSIASTTSALQHAFEQHPNIAQNFGPNFLSLRDENGVQPIYSIDKLFRQHSAHLHIGGLQ
jgi:hypothetical protein